MSEEYNPDIVTVIDENGENHGVVSITQALEMADNAGLDLIEISPQAAPPFLCFFHGPTIVA